MSTGSTQDRRKFAQDKIAEMANLPGPKQVTALRQIAAGVLGFTSGRDSIIAVDNPQLPSTANVVGTLTNEFGPDYTANAHTLLTSEIRGSVELETIAMETSFMVVQAAVEKAAATYEEWFTNYEPPSREFQTRCALIDPILHALGWDTTDHTVYYREWHYKNGAGIVDYALFPRSTAQDLVEGLAVPAIIIEAKSVYRSNQPKGEYGQAIWDKDVQQLQRYVDLDPRMDEGLAVFTNGRIWLLYILGDGRRLRDIDPRVADIERFDAASNAETLYETMGRQHW